MAVIQYQCDTCERIIDIPQNKQGLETIQRCVITDGCRGKLSEFNIKLDHIRGNFPDRVAGLTDWSQREVLFNFVQSVELSEWVINHELGVIPAIQVFVIRPKPIDLTMVDIDTLDLDSLIEFIEVEPEEIITVNLNTLIVKFNRPESGKAQLIARASKPIVDEILAPVEEITQFQLSDRQELTIATLDTSTNVDLELEFINPDGTIVSVAPYSVDDQVSIISPWVNANKIFINGKTYTVRSFDFLTGVPEFANNTIADGAFFYFKELQSLPLEQNDMLILLANSPYANQDKILNQFIDPHTITQANAINSFFFNKRELFTVPSLISSTYPFIKIV